MHDLCRFSEFNWKLILWQIWILMFPWWARRKETQGFQQEDPQVQHMSAFAQKHRCGRLFVNPWIFSGVDGESVSPGEDSGPDPELHEDGGSNLVDSRPSVAIQEPILLDLSRDLVDTDLFESYTSTGTIFKKLTDTHFLSLPTCLSL